MCGISGFIIKNNKYIDKANKYSKKLIKNLKNRGPDSNNIYKDNNVVLCHNRLSIIDLNKRSDQPFIFKNLVIIFNGEIYNYVNLRQYLINNYNSIFESESDTEVLIQLIYYVGLKKALKLLNGIFVFSVYNKKDKTINIVRDRIGIKYCYYYEDENIFIYSSNPAAIVKTLYEVDNKKWKLNINSLFSYLSSGICLSKECMFENIYGLDSGCLINIDVNINNIIKKKWWIPNFNRENENLEKYIKHSIKIQERGDVGKNILFSGGIDSSIIAYFSKKSNFLTIDLGELNYAKNILKNLKKENKLNIINSDFLNKNIHRFIDEQRKIINFTGIPTKASYIMTLSGLYIKENQKNKKILLSGIGGNELFYGHRRIKLENKGFKSHLRDLYIYLSQIKPLENKYKNKLIEYKKNFVENIYKEINIPDNLKVCNISRWLELKTFLLNDLLVNADAIYMYYSIEARVPLLDHNIVEISLSKNPIDFFYDKNIIKNKPTWNEYTQSSKKILKDILKKKINNENIFKEKYSYDVERHKLHPMYIDLCNKFLKRNIIGWNGSWTKYNSPLIGNLELWFQEFEYLLEI